MTESLPDSNLIARLEAVEQEASVSMFQNAPQASGLQVHRVGGALVRVDLSERGLLNRVNGLGVQAPATERDLDAIVELYRRSGVSSAGVNLSPSAKPRELSIWLEARGFKHAGNAAKIYRRAGNPPSIERTDFTIAEVTADRTADLAIALEGGFGMTAGRGAVVAASAGRPGWRWFVAYDLAQPVAAGGLYAHDGAAWLGYGATMPSHRRRGAQGAIIAARVAAAAEMGCEWVTSETAEDKPEAPVSSYHNMIRNGFELLFLRPFYMLKFE